jgi:2-hydroxy-3-oxopropionate reductase
LHIKDLLNAVAAGQSINSPVPLTVQVLEMMKVLKINDCALQDHSALVKYYEQLAKIEVRNI